MGLELHITNQTCNPLRHAAPIKLLLSMLLNGPATDRITVVTSAWPRTYYDSKILVKHDNAKTMTPIM